jgi:hypothetical protein
MNNYISLGEIGAIVSDLPADLVDDINTTANNLQADFSKGSAYNDSLVGHIKHEYALGYNQK